MPDFEREKYGLARLEQEPKEMRFAVIFEDDIYNVEQWVGAFNEVPNLRCIAPNPRWGYTKELVDVVNSERIVLVVADRFVENYFLHIETSAFLDWLRTDNPEAFVVETSIVNFSGCKYKGANVMMCSFFDRLLPTLEAVRGTEQNTWMAKIYALQLMAVPELLKAKKFDGLKEEDVTVNELFQEFFRLEDNSQYHEMISRIEVDYDEVACLFGKFDPKSALVFLHCAYSIIGHLNLRHDETYFAMAISRIKALLEDVRRSGPSV